MEKAAIGFRAKTGRAIAVVLSGSAAHPRFVWRGEVSLVDPASEATKGPYHEVMELPWSEAIVAVRPIERAIERIAQSVLSTLIADKHIIAVGVVGSPPRPLDRIGNQHIRAHAAEGILFRRVLEEAAAHHHLPCLAFSEAELKDAASQDAIKELGRVAGAPWRTDERLAAAAARRGL